MTIKNIKNFFSIKIILLSIIILYVFFTIWIIYYINKKYLLNTIQMEKYKQFIINQINDMHVQFIKFYNDIQKNIQENIIKIQLLIQQTISNNVYQQMNDIRNQIHCSFKQHAESITINLQLLTEEIRNYLHNLTQQVNSQLTEGFEKTSFTFTNVIQRLTIIDEAQKKIQSLSEQVVSLQDILVDKQSRGAFGEMQLNSIVGNMIPKNHYRMQYTLSNKKRADCILFLPHPTGNIVIDSKFPLETYKKLMNTKISITDKKILKQKFRQDLQKHIKNISEKYIIFNETADSALMFIPAETIFSEIHTNYPDIIDLSHRLRVWLVSPSTLMAVLTTARAVLKDDATRRQVNIIHKHLQELSNDFNRFEKRMEKLYKHINAIQQDANEVNTSAKKISKNFKKIDTIELENSKNKKYIKKNNVHQQSI